MNEIVVPKPVLIDELNEFAVAGNLFDGAKVHLYANDFTPDDQSVIGDFVEATYTGYAPSTVVVWSAAGYAPNGRPTLPGGTKTFVSGSPLLIANTVYGYYVTDTAGTKLLWSERFVTPVIISAPAQIIAVLPAYPNFQPSN